MSGRVTLGQALLTLLNPRYQIKTGLELLRVALGFSHQMGPMEADQATTSKQGVDVYFQDGRELSLRGRRRWRLNPRPLEKVEAYGFHTTGVDRGFGVSKNQIRPWLAAWDRLERAGLVRIRRPPREGRDTPWIPEGTSPDVARYAWARLMAVRERYLGLPYHSLSCPRTKELIINHEPETYTHHGNGMNRYTWGHAMDDVWSDGEDVSQDRVELELAHLERLHKHTRDEGATPKYCETHSQHTRKPHDPGSQYVELVVQPFAREQGLIIRAEAHSGKGRPLSLAA